MINQGAMEYSGVARTIKGRREARTCEQVLSISKQLTTMSPPSEVNLEKLRIPREQIDNVAGSFTTGKVINPDVDKYVGWLYEHYREDDGEDDREDGREDDGEDGRLVMMLPEVDIKSRWYGECEGTIKSGFLYSDELKVLSRLDHKNILPFIGYCDEKDIFLQQGADEVDKVILVHEIGWSFKSLAEHLLVKEVGTKERFPWAERLKICIGVANGLNYLHSCVKGVGRVIHNDMQSKNIWLVPGNLRLEPKIKGFYHSIIIPENQPHTQVNSHVRHEHHPDPIYHEIGLLDTTTDVYSYGILMFEMLLWMVANEEKVIGDYKPQKLINIVRRNKPEQLIDPFLRDHIDPRSFKMFIDIAYRCISLILKDRPAMDEVANELTKALDIHKRAPSPSGDLRPTKENIANFFIPLEEMQLAIRNSQKITGCRFYKTELFNNHGQKGPVAVKMFNDDDNSFQAKLEIVSRLRHKNIITFIGYGTLVENRRRLVYEYADNGSLSTNLRKLTWTQRLKICIGAAKGLKYLHSGLGEYESVIHAEFTSQNILVSDNLEAKICGLDSSFLVPRNHSDTEVYEKPVGGQEMDPMYRESGIPNVEFNVYSLGVVLFEILTGKLAYASCYGDEEPSLMALVRRHDGDHVGFNEFIDPKIRKEIYVRSLHICKEIAYKCTSYNIKDRPSLNKIIKRLEEALYIQEHSLPSDVTGRGLEHKNLEAFRIPPTDINLATGVKIGEGSFGEVYKVQLPERWENRTVAIKYMLSKNYQGEIEFRKELNMIFSFNHENIIPFIGYCDEGNERIIVYEYASNGSLDNHLKHEEKRRELTWDLRLKICLGAARGLDYLHTGLEENYRVIHRDVKSANILLDHNFVAKVCDFGLSKYGPTNQPQTQVFTNAAGTNIYMDPIYHDSGILRKESDVYSFGVVMFELLSGMLAHHRRIGDDDKHLINLVRRYYDYRPDLLVDPLIRDEIDSRSFNVFREVAFQCISYNSKERPTMEAIGDRIEEALKLQVSNQRKRKRKVTES